MQELHNVLFFKFAEPQTAKHPTGLSVNAYIIYQHDLETDAAMAPA